MKIDAFLTCLGYFGVSTGASTALEGAYALSSGTTGLFYNQLYSTGAHFLSGQIYAPTVPLLNVYNNVINNSRFSGANGLRVGAQHTGDFALLLDIGYSGCSHNFGQKGMVLLSTAMSSTGLNTGFMIGITESNRLYFNTSGYHKTLDKELRTRDFVYVSLAENRYVTFGIYSLQDNILHKESIGLPNPTLNSKDIYLGNFLNTNSTDPYTGYVGKINQVVLFRDTLTDDDVSTCANCSIITGVNTQTTIYSFFASQLTGIYFSGIMEAQVTGSINVSSSVVTHNGSALTVFYPSGLSGYVQTGQIVIPMFSGVNVQHSSNGYAFLYDQSALNEFSTFSLYFNTALTSGDTIEVYTYPKPNINIGKAADGVNVPTDTGAIQMIANGLNEDLGVDYTVVRNQFSGLYPDDVLAYDVLVAPTISTAYSGYWNSGSRLLLSGGAYYPPTSQYLENMTSFPGVIKVTGISGICHHNPFYPRFGYDLYMNGQKMISGMYFQIATSGISGFVISLSGNSLPPLTVYGLYDATGGGPTGVDYVDDSNLSFVPQYSGFIQARYDVNVTSNTFTFFTGFGEQVWVNGIRNLANIDYIVALPCSLITGISYPPELNFALYDSEVSDGLWNLRLPPYCGGVTVQNNADGTVNVNVGNIAPVVTNDYPYSGYPCMELWQSYLTADLVSMSSYELANFYQPGTNTLTYLGSYTGAFIGGKIVVKARYNYNNIIGPWNYSPLTNVSNVA